DRLANQPSRDLAAARPPRPDAGMAHAAILRLWAVDPVDLDRQVAAADRRVQYDAGDAVAEALVQGRGDGFDVPAVAHIDLEPGAAAEMRRQFGLALARGAEQGVEIGQGLAELGEHG